MRNSSLITHGFHEINDEKWDEACIYVKGCGWINVINRSMHLLKSKITHKKNDQRRG